MLTSVKKHKGNKHSYKYVVEFETYIKLYKTQVLYNLGNINSKYHFVLCNGLTYSPYMIYWIFVLYFEIIFAFTIALILLFWYNVYSSLFYIICKKILEVKNNGT
jgi:hypothetical protein